MFQWGDASCGAKTALIENGREVTYKQLFDFSNEITDKIKERTLVFSLCTNSVASIAGYVGFFNARIVPLLLDAAISKDLLNELISTYRPSYLWAPEAEKEAFSAYRCVFEKEGYALLKAEKACPFALHEDLGVLISTSGSTGSPKLVRQTYVNIRSNTESIIQYLGITDSERAITSLPMNYVYGLSVLNTHLEAGASLVLTNENCYSKSFWDLFHSYGATSFAGVPFMYEMLNKLRFFKKDIPSLRYFTQAGGKLNADLQEKLTKYAAEHGKKFVVMYGASEATARMAYLPMEDALKKKGSIGIPIPGGRFEIWDEEDKPIQQPLKTGELIYYGENVTLGYASCGADLSKADENKGRLVTGDMAQFDEDGFYYIVGRKKRFIKMFGNRINLDDVDTVLKQKFDVLDLVSCGKDDFLDIFVTEESLIEPIYDYVYETFGINKKRMAVYLIEEIPHNPSGKVLYSKLEELKA